MPQVGAFPRVGTRAMSSPFGVGVSLLQPCRPLMAAGIAGLCLTLIGCSAARISGSRERQAIIDQIVATSAKVTIEEGGRRIGSASGVVVASTTDGADRDAASYVLTAAHVLDGKDGAKIFVRFTGAYAGRGKFVATVSRQGNSKTLDLALLRVPGIAVPPASFPDGDRVGLGEEILVVGFPWGKRLGIFSGIVSQVPSDTKDDVTGEEASEQTIVVDAATANGVSGGGVYREATGALVGIVEGFQTASVAVKDRSRTYSVKVPMPGETFVVPVAGIRRFLGEVALDGALGGSGQAGNRKQ